MTLTVGSINTIRPDDVYGGYRIKITAVYDTIETPFTVDISTGDVITPQSEKYIFHGIFDEEKQIEIWAYNVETVMAEKIEAILSRNILGTRPRDFYDIFILSTTQPYDAALLKVALSATSEHRGTLNLISDIQTLLHIITNSTALRQMWEKYRREFDYAAYISYEQVIETLRNVCLKLR